MTFGLCSPQLSFIQSSNHSSGPCVCIFSPTMSSEEQQSTSVESEAVPEKDESPETSSDESDSPESHPKSSPPGPSSVTDPTPGPSSQSGLKAKKEERMKRLRELHLRRNEARKLNHVEVVEEDKRNKLPANWETRKKKVEWELAEEEAKKEAELAGEDYDRVKLLDVSAADLERKEKKLRRKKNPDPGFSDFAQLQHRQYERVVKEIEPNMSDYEKQKAKMGADFYPTVNTLLHGGDGGASEAGMDRMVADLDKQIDKRGKYRRKRANAADADVDYINDKNMRFNKKVSRFYDKYTTEIKQNLERGTAI